MLKLRTAGGLAFAAGALAIAAPATAAEFLFTFDGLALQSSGTLTVDDTPNAEGGYLITNITGTVNQVFDLTVTGLLPVNSERFNNDNLLFVGQDILLSGSGFGYTTDDGSIGQINFSDGRYTNFITSGFLGFIQSGTFTIQAVEAAVPEPATWLMMLFGFGFVGGMMRQRKQQVRVTYA